MENTLMRWKVGPFGVMLALAALLVAVAPGAVLAHTPAGVDEPADAEFEPIVIEDADGKVEEFTLDTVKELHGHLCICGVAAFRAASLALGQLYGEGEVPVRGEVDVVYYHPGKAHQQVMHHLFTPEHVAIEKLHPQQLNAENFHYVFTRTDIGETVEVQVNEEIIPADFTELRYAVNGFENQWHDVEPTQETRDAFATVYSDVLETFTTEPDQVIYAGVEEPAEPAPIGAIAFSAGILVLLGLGFVFSAQTRSRTS